MPGYNTFSTTSPPDGYAGFVLANGALSNVNRSEEVAIRKALVEAGVIDCIVALPTKLFANTPIPVSLWFIGKSRKETDVFRGRENETLFIDARKLGHPVSRRQRELSPSDIALITDTYHAFRSATPTVSYADVDGFCKVASRKDIEGQGYVISPGRYVGTEDDIEDELQAPERLALLESQLLQELDTASKAEAVLRGLLKEVTGDDI
jgi:type I restriction enzyme M protein